jgi:predicted SAM-dependent methyltransferase
VDKIKWLSRYTRGVPSALFSYGIKLINSLAYHAYIFKVLRKQFRGLHLGSGYAKINNFCNIDANPRALCDVVARITKIKLSSNSVGMIYNSHVFEHIPREQAKDALAEWYRLLKPGGKLYICVPDLEVLFKVYLDNLPQYHTEKGRYLVDRACYLTFGGQTNRYDFHFYGYSFVTLRDMLERVGFKDVRRFDRSKLKIAPFDDISTVRIDDLPMSLNIEASK